MKNKEKIILLALKDLLKSKNIDDISMDDIAKSASISVGSIYTYYKSKSDLITALFQNYHIQFHDNLKIAYENNSSIGIEKLYNILVISFEFINQNLFIAKSYFLESLDFDKCSKDISSLKMNCKSIDFDFMINTCLLEEYGDKIAPHLNDLQTILIGMCISFISTIHFKRLFLTNKNGTFLNVSSEKIAQKIIFSLKSIVEKSLNSNQEAILVLNESNSIEKNTDKAIEKNFITFFKDLEVGLDKIKIDNTEKNRLLSIINFMKLEFSDKNPRIFIIMPLLKEFLRYDELRPYLKSMPALL